MGDTGSLSLGGSLGAIGIITKHEIVLAITGGLFVLEAMSVIVQVVSYKLTGKRVFRMAPIHHHFEKKGWPESTVVIRFWIISIIWNFGIHFWIFGIYFDFSDFSDWFRYMFLIWTTIFNNQS